MQTRTWKAPEIAQRRPLSARDIQTQITPEEALAKVRRAVEAPAPCALVRVPAVSDYRALGTDEISALEARGSTAEDWSRVRVAESFDPARIARVRFVGDVLLGRLDNEKAAVDLYDAVIANSVIGDGACVSSVGLVASQAVGRGAVLTRTQEIVASGSCAFGNGREIALGIETGGREVLSFAELSVLVADCVAKRRDLKDFLAEYESLVRAYVDAVRLDRGFIGDGAVISGCGRVGDSFIGPHARIERATFVENATVLSSEDEPSRVGDGCIVRDSILQWGCEVDSMSIVSNSVLTEHSHVERHGKVSESILGPNSGVGEGEVTACLVGPFVAFHHQALLIAAVWPEGRGNIAYGANVGSNHTSRAPDQEIWPGEGVFFGLGCDIKYPANFSEAPYSIIASGVTMLPQRIAMPFSLVNPPARNVEAISPSFNEIMPGWVLYANFYALARNEAKFRQRNQARRSEFDFSVFRPEITLMMLRAREELRSVPHQQNFYTDADLPGIGKNYLSESSRTLAIGAYTRHILLWCLRQLLAQVEALPERGARRDAGLLAQRSDDERWEFARELLLHERPTLSVREGLELLAREQRALAAEAQHSKERDDQRGSLTIPGFLDARSPASEDPVIRQLWAEGRSLVERTERVLEALG